MVIHDADAAVKPPGNIGLKNHVLAQLLLPLDLGKQKFFPVVGTVNAQILSEPIGRTVGSWESRSASLTSS